jgi:hypothetical protein
VYLGGCVGVFCSLVLFGFRVFLVFLGRTLGLSCSTGICICLVRDRCDFVNLWGLYAQCPICGACMPNLFFSYLSHVLPCVLLYGLAVCE